MQANPATKSSPATPALKAVNKPAKVAEKGLFTKPELLQWYQTMLEMRRFEEKAAALYQQQAIQGFCHLYIGQEAVAAGLKAISYAGDDFITSYRCHALGLVCGLSMLEIMGELTGRAVGISKGKGGSMHMFEPSKGFWGGHGIVAAQVPLGAGISFARKYQAEVLGEGLTTITTNNSQLPTTQRVCFTFIGDGAMNAGQVFETFNMAALWKLPTVFVIENNQYGMGTSVPRAAAGELYKRGECFGIPGEKVDGMDFLAVAAAGQRAADYCRAGKGPYLLEMDTYRYRGHSMSDPAKYRTRDDVDQVREGRDPIARLQKLLMAEHSVAESHFETLDEEVKAAVNVCAEAALVAPLPSEAELWTDVYPENLA